MPSASPELQALMKRWFGSIDSDGPERFLWSRGYVLTRGYQWQLPTLAHTMRDEELQCIRFLIFEWDYGGLATNAPHDLENRTTTKS